MPERGGETGRRHRVVVIGGGLSGLAVAHRIQERSALASSSASGPVPALAPTRPSIDLALLEARERLGGVIVSERRDGFLFEGGPDSFITNKPWGLDLCRRLGIDDHLIETDPAHRRSFVVRKGRLVPVPEGFVLMAPRRLVPLLTTPVLSWRGKLRVLMDLFLPRRDEGPEESLGAFVRRRLGREALERLIQPLVAGIYTADLNHLSLKATLPRFLEMERDHGGLIRGGLREARKSGPLAAGDCSGARYGLFVALDEGMGALPAALAAKLPAGSVRLNTAVRRIVRNGPVSPWLVEPLDGPPIEADAVVLATEAHAAARLIDVLDPALALQLRGIPYASSIIVNVSYRRDQVLHPLDGFGAVVPAIEGRSILAVTFLSVKFPNRAPAGTVLLRVFLGGATRPEFLERDDAEIGEIVRNELESLIGASGEPLALEISRHPRAMPQYVLGHLERLETVRRALARHPGLYLTGIAYDGVGIPDCVRAAEATADRLCEALINPAASAA